MERERRPTPFVGDAVWADLADVVTLDAVSHSGLVGRRLQAAGQLGELHQKAATGQFRSARAEGAMLRGEIGMTTGNH